MLDKRSGFFYFRGLFQLSWEGIQERRGSIGSELF